MARWATFFLTGSIVLCLSNTALGQLKPEDRPELLEGFTEAAKRLQKPDCGDLFGPKGREVFLSATYIVISFGKPQLNSDGKFNVISASTDRERNIIMINSEGPYMNPRLAVHGVRFNFGLKDREFRALLLLHELGHLAGRFKHDAADPALSRSYTTSVLEACFE